MGSFVFFSLSERPAIRNMTAERFQLKFTIVKTININNNCNNSNNNNIDIEHATHPKLKFRTSFSRVVCFVNDDERVRAIWLVPYTIGRVDSQFRNWSQPVSQSLSICLYYIYIVLVRCICQQIHTVATIQFFDLFISLSPLVVVLPTSSNVCYGLSFTKADSYPCAHKTIATSSIST